MIGASATDWAIRAADRRSTLRIVPCTSDRWGEYVAIKDEHGTIETHETFGQANLRVRLVCGRRDHGEAAQ